MSTLRDLIPADALKAWDGTKAEVVTAPKKIDDFGFVTLKLTNKNGKVTWVYFDLPVGYSSK